MYIYVYIHTYIYVCMYVCMYVYIYIYIYMIPNVIHIDVVTTIHLRAPAPTRLGPRP